ncbi:hypothetical protein EWM62_04270 [Mucilaginibacter terrigena]|uniref:Outer membrane protein beta-barrel domain-containing protein n=1 Tax=Mucilaginibacter terrigena TaxID=2492395 RepID=A0A4Q5LP68_9SPHI|nr:hypothetical protein [Mucilaginibacter terrigena]RYU91162.1 hypothetical protein EWM62_04270 [Mucilaginibacter terrigena]
MRATLLTLITCLFFVQFSKAQSGGFVIKLRTIRPSTHVFGDSSNGSVGVSLGYGKVSKDGRLGVDLTAFGDILGYKFDLPNDRNFDGSTIYTGIAITPRYCFNPDDDVQFSVSLSFKTGYNYGSGIVNQYNFGSDDRQIENQTVKAGYSMEYSPAISIGFPFETGSVGLDIGYDSTDYGRGINKLRSKYYPPLNIHSDCMYVGVFFRFGH